MCVANTKQQREDCLLVYRWLFPALWSAWVVYWVLASIGAKPTERREPLGSRLLHVVPLFVAFALLAGDGAGFGVLHTPLFPRAPWLFWLAALVTAAGLLFSVWARVHIGRNWSGVVTIKQDHELVDTGPYALVRHPIYTGLLVAFVGTALGRDEWRGVLAVAIAWAALWRKLKTEERWMTERFGERYADYRRRVPALIPSLVRKR